MIAGCWVIDGENLVHSVHCPAKGTEFTPYVSKVPYSGLAGDSRIMHEWLVQPDYRDGRTGPAAVRPCTLCLPLAEEA